MKSKSSKIAEESKQTDTVRRKLQRKIEKMDRKITEEALKKKLGEIHRWIAKNANDRVVLRGKSIALFDGNQNTAPVGKKISAILEQLKESSEGQKSGEEPADLLKKMIVSRQQVGRNS